MKWKNPNTHIWSSLSKIRLSWKASLPQEKGWAEAGKVLERKRETGCFWHGGRPFSANQRKKSCTIYHNCTGYHFGCHALYKASLQFWYLYSYALRGPLRGLHRNYLHTNTRTSYSYFCVEDNCWCYRAEPTSFSFGKRNLPARFRICVDWRENFWAWCGIT